MIDVDPNFRGAYRRQRSAEPILDSCVECDRNIDILRVGRRFGEQIGARKKTIFLEHAVFVPDANIFAELFEREAEGELTSERVAIGADVTKNSEPLIFAQGLADLLEFLAHSRFSLSASICCKISTIREPRAIDSSR